MLAASPRKQPKPLVGSPLPRIAPPTPAKADLTEFRKVAAKIGLTLWPWQETAARYMLAVNADGDPLHREVCIVVARRNGKTELLKPYTVSRLLDGQAITHVAQTLKLPGLFFAELVAIFEKHYPTLIPRKRGVSWRAGQEELRLTTGGVYRLVAAKNGAARGLTNDVVMIDELREMNDLSVLAAIAPTVAHSRKRQRVYITNAGTDESVCLKSIQARADASDPSLAYIEWSAAPERKADELAGWLEANPAIGHNPAILEGLHEDYQAAKLGGTLPDFETERLCRYQPALESRLVSDDAWAAQSFGDVGRPMRAFMAVKMDITGERASAVVAWQDGETICVDVHDTKGSPIDVSLLGPDIIKIGRESRVIETAFDPYTDADLAEHLVGMRARAINGREYAAASEKLVRLVAERKLRVNDPTGILAEDLRWTVRRSAAMGSYMAVAANDEHSNTAAVAMIRAVWLASRPVPSLPARIH